MSVGISDALYDLLFCHDYLINNRMAEILHLRRVKLAAKIHIFDIQCQRYPYFLPKRALLVDNYLYFCKTNLSILKKKHN